VNRGLSDSEDWDFEVFVNVDEVERLGFQEQFLDSVFDTLVMAFPARR